jgi:hypothetical protein
MGKNKERKGKWNRVLACRRKEIGRVIYIEHWGTHNIEGPKPTHVKKGRGAVGSYISLAATC